MDDRLPASKVQALHNAPTLFPAWHQHTGSKWSLEWDESPVSCDRPLAHAESVRPTHESFLHKPALRPLNMLKCVLVEVLNLQLHLERRTVRSKFWAGVLAQLQYSMSPGKSPSLKPYFSCEKMCHDNLRRLDRMAGFLHSYESVFCDCFNRSSFYRKLKLRWQHILCYFSDPTDFAYKKLRCLDRSPQMILYDSPHEEAVTSGV